MSGRSSKRRDAESESERQGVTKSKTTDGASGTAGADGRVERLHRTVGNRALQRAADGGGGVGSGIPMGSPDSSYEREAEAVSTGVLRGESSVPNPSRMSGSRVQREARSDAGGGGERAPPSVAETVDSPGESLDPEVRSSMESKLGADFGSVRVHTGPQAARSAREIGARAYTVGDDVAFDSGEYAPDTTAGREVLAHELTHVAQQGGRDLAVQAMSATGGTTAGGSRREPGSGKPTAGEAAEAGSYASLADDVYEDAGAPEGWTRLENFSNEESGFFAALYRNANSGEVVLAFRGTNPLELADWTRANLPNALNEPSKQYRAAIDLANTVSSQYGDVTFTGHSLGGGLASAASMATGREAVTFNPAGPAPNQVLEIDPSKLLTADPKEDITAYVVRGDVLTWFQDLVGGQVANHPLGEVTGGTWTVVSSPAQGTRKQLPQPSDGPENPWDLAEWGSEIIGLKQHGMETVKDALSELQGSGG